MTPPKKKAPPSASCSLAGLLTIQAMPGDYEAEEPEGPLRPHRASPEPAGIPLSSTVVPSFLPVELAGSGTSASVKMAGGAIADETVELPPASPLLASSEPSASLRDAITKFVPVALNPSLVRDPPMQLVDCVTEFPDEAATSPKPPEEPPTWPPPGTTPLREAVPRVPVIGPLRSESDRMAEAPLPSASGLGPTVIPVSPPTAPRSPSPVVVEKRKPVRRPLSGLELDLLVTLALLLLVAFLTWLSSPY